MDHGRSKLFDRAPIMELQQAWETSSAAFFRAALLDGIPPFIIDGIKRGLYGASVGGEPIEVEVERFPGRSAHNPKGLEELTYKEVRVHDVSLTANPAYESATVTLRARDYLGDDSGPVIHRVALAPVVMRSEFLLPPSSRRDYLGDDDYFLEAPEPFGPLSDGYLD